MRYLKVENRIILLEIPELVTCKICNKKYKAIKPNHLQKHNYTMELYKKKFPNAHLECSTTRIKKSRIKKEHYKTHESIFKKPYNIKNVIKNKNLWKFNRLVNKLIHNLPKTKKRQSESMKKKWSDKEFYEKNIKLWNENRKKPLTKE